MEGWRGSGLRRLFAPGFLCLESFGIRVGDFHAGVGIGGAARNIIQDLLARNGDNDGTLIAREIFFPDFLDRSESGVLISLNIFGKVTGIAGVLVVGVEGIGNSAETTQALEALDFLRESEISRLIEFRPGGSVATKHFNLLVDSFFQVFRFHAWTGSNIAGRNGAELQRLIAAFNGLSNLFFIDKLAVKAARFASSEDLNE